MVKKKKRKQNRKRGSKKKSNFKGVTLRKAPKQSLNFIRDRPILVALSLLFLLIIFSLGGIIGGLVITGITFILTPLIYYKLGKPIHRYWKKLLKMSWKKLSTKTTKTKKKVTGLKIFLEWKVILPMIFYFLFLTLGLLELREVYYPYSFLFGLLSIGFGVLFIYFLKNFSYWQLIFFVPHLLLFIFALLIAF